MSWEISFLFQPQDFKHPIILVLASVSWTQDRFSSLMTLGDVVMALIVCNTRQLLVSTRLKVSLGVARSMVAASHQPLLVKCHSLTNSFFSNRFRTWCAGLRSRKPGVRGSLAQSGWLCEDLFLISSTTHSFSFSFPCTNTP